MVLEDHCGALYIDYVQHGHVCIFMCIYIYMYIYYILFKHSFLYIRIYVRMVKFVEDTWCTSIHTLVNNSGTRRGLLVQTDPALSPDRCLVFMDTITHYTIHKR